MADISSKQVPSRYIVEVWYAFPEAISKEVDYGSLWVGISLNEWTQIYFTPGTAKLESTSKTDFTGKLINNKFEMNVPGSANAFDGEIFDLTGRAIVLRIVYSDGNSLIAGGKEKKLRLEYKKDINTVSGHILTFDYDSRTAFKLLD
jgi:hypothetical protein